MRVLGNGKVRFVEPDNLPRGVVEHKFEGALHQAVRSGPVSPTPLAGDSQPGAAFPTPTAPFTSGAAF